MQMLTAKTIHQKTTMVATPEMTMTMAMMVTTMATTVPLNQTMAAMATETMTATITMVDILDRIFHC